MGKASKWFRAIFGLKASSRSTTTDPNKKTNAWSFGKTSNKNLQQKPTPHGVSFQNDDEASKHAIAVAAATAAVAEAAVAAAQAAAAVVKLTSGGAAASASRQLPAYVSGGACYRREDATSSEEWAAVVVQSHFRGHLARKALRALKGLVKIQALVRGHLVRKQTACTLKRLHALIRAQERVRSGRVMLSESPHSTKKSSQFNFAGPGTPEKFEHVIRARNLSRNEHVKINGSKLNTISNHDPEKLNRSLTRMDSNRNNERTWEHGSLTNTFPADDDRSDKILEVDTMSQHIIPKRRNLFHSSHLSISSEQNCQSFSTSKDSIAHQSILSPSSCEVQSLFHFNPDIDESAFYTADNSPQFHSSSTISSCRRETFTPARSDASRSCLSNYSDYRNYMVCTESSKAKARSLSAPKQRPYYERSSSTKRYSVHGGGYGDSRSNSQRAAQQNLHANFANKAYPGSGRLDRLGMPVRSGDTRGFSGGLWH